MKKILFVCTGNTCRSQMAEGIANSLSWISFSAGTNPEINVNPHAIEVMNEIGLNISNHYPKLIDEINLNEIDVIMTVCSNADKNCPTFPGFSGQKLHYSFDDPEDIIGTKQEILSVFRRVRNEIMTHIKSTII